MDDETLMNGANESSQDSLPVTNGEASQPEAEQAQTPPPGNYLSREDFEKWQTEQDAKWQARLQEVERKAQAKSDKARDTAIRKAKEFDSYAESMKAAGIELDPEQVATVKQTIISREFWADEPAPSAQAQSSAPTQVQSIQPSGGVPKDEIISYLAREGLNADAIAVDKFVGRDRFNADWTDFEEDVALAKAKKIEAKRAQQQQSNANAAAQVKQNYGSVAPVAAGAPSAGYDPLTRYNEMINKGYPASTQAFNEYMRELDKLEAELRKAGRLT